MQHAASTSRRPTPSSPTLRTAMASWDPRPWKGPAPLWSSSRCGTGSMPCLTSPTATRLGWGIKWRRGRTWRAQTRRGPPPALTRGARPTGPRSSPAMSLHLIPSSSAHLARGLWVRSLPLLTLHCVRWWISTSRSTRGSVSMRARPVRSSITMLACSLSLGWPHIAPPIVSDQSPSITGTLICTAAHLPLPVQAPSIWLGCPQPDDVLM
mmetsp:Transcript_17120/g.52907  ORF Transcript_17120/g.52907 Transcript_17120/m.52907 type:complete len:210 (+) Transcript_17120:224-853(+)